MTPTDTRKRLALLVLVTTIFIDFVGFSIPIPVLPAYLKNLGVEGFHVPLVTAAYALGLVLFLPLWGWVSDRIGRRPVLLVSLAGTAVSFALLALADSLPTVYLARFLGGFFGASIGTAQAYVTDLTDRDSRVTGMGLIGGASALGLAMGAALGGALAWQHITLPFYATAAVAGLAFLLAAVSLPESRSPHTPDRGLAGLGRVLVPTPVLVALEPERPRKRLYLYLFLHIFFAFSAIEAMFPLFAMTRFGWSPGQIALFMMGTGAVLVVTQTSIVGPLSRVWGEAPLTTVGLLVMGVSMVGLGLSHHVVPLAAWGCGLMFGSGLVLPTFTSLFSRVDAAHEAGEAMSQSQAMVHTGRTLGGICWAWIFGVAGAGAPFLMSGLVTLGAAAIFVGFLRLLLAEDRRPDEKPDPPAVTGSAD